MERVITMLWNAVITMAWRTHREEAAHHQAWRDGRCPALDGPSATARGVHSEVAITWLTRRESIRLLQRNRYITGVLELGPEALAHPQTRTFDRVITLQASKPRAA